MIHTMNHFTITAEDRKATLDFYCGLLGLEEGHRPDLGFPGAWLYPPGGKAAILHIYWDRPMPSQRTGVIDHMAFTTSDLKAVKARLVAYHNQTAPILPYYEKKGLLRSVDGMAEMADVARQIDQVLAAVKV